MGWAAQSYAAVSPSSTVVPTCPPLYSGTGQELEPHLDKGRNVVLPVLSSAVGIGSLLAGAEPRRIYWALRGGNRHRIQWQTVQWSCPILLFVCPPFALFCSVPERLPIAHSAPHQ